MPEPSLANFQEWEVMERGLLAEDFIRMGIELPSNHERASLADFYALIRTTQG
jgi:hypothetical protein